jgi:indole-3-glycerol phosphate synthase
MTILDEIVANKRIEVAQLKEQISIKQLEKSVLFKRTCYSLYDAIKNNDKPSIIAEFKRKSPSKGIINDKVAIEYVTSGYTDAGAVCLSVLTDKKYFGGTQQDLITARKINDIPILRKEFIIDEYQIYESKALGADVVLLIASCLTKEEIHHFSSVAKSLQLDILFEIHDEHELDKLSENIKIIGVNNRNLKNFDVDVNTSLNLANKIPNDCIKVSESGLNDASTILNLHQAGYKAFLMGESFMRTIDPPKALYQLIEQL